MPQLQIQHYSGDLETRELDRKQPVSIGRHERNDIVIDDDDVAIMHCRIAWSRNGFEVVAANLDGVDVNGTLVRRAELKAGDVLRVGTVDFTIRDDGGGSAPAGTQRPDSAIIALKPATDDAIPLKNWSTQSVARTVAAEEETTRRHQQLEEESVFAKRRPEKEPSRPKDKRSARKESSRRKEPEPAPLAALFDDEDDGEVALLPAAEPSEAELPAADEAGAEGEADAAEGPLIGRHHSDEESQAAVAAVEKPPLVERLKEIKTKLSGQTVRPGEQDIIRHPLVLTLGGGTTILVLVAVTLWFIIGRQSAERDYAAAAALMEAHDYPGAIRQFHQFVQDYPATDYTESAIYNRDKSKVLQHIFGTTAKWREGLAELQNFVRDHSDRPTFSEHLPDVVDYARQIALGAARTAQATKDRSLLSVIDEARTIVQRRSPVDDPPRELLGRIQTELKTATDAVEKQEFFDARAAEIEAALKAERPIPALEIRAKLLERFPDLVTHRRVVELLKRSLDTEKAIIEKLTEADAAPEPVLSRDERPVPAPVPVSLTMHTRSRRTETSDDRTPVVFAVAGGCCYGIDSVTGQPLWRRTIGLDNPVFPIPVETSTPALLLFDRTWRDLVLVNRRTGELLWRLELGDDLGGQPLVVKSQCIVPTLGNRVYKIDLEGGRVTKRWTFSQRLLAPPTLVNNDEHAVIAGDEGLLYVLSLRPFECQTVEYLGHRSGSIHIGPLTLGRLVLVAENDRTNSSRLRVLDAGRPEQGLPPVAETRVDGLVRDTPVLRRNQLFVPSSGERIAAFTVSDERGKPPLVRIAVHQLQTPHSGPMHLSAGADGQLWMGTSAVRRFELQADTIKLDTNRLPPGVSTQPLVAAGSHLYSGRRLPFAQAVLFTRADQEQMVGDWRATLGERILAAAAGGDSLVCVGETGNVFRVTAADVGNGGFLLTGSRLQVSEETVEPLRARALDDGRIAVACGLPEPQFWIVNTVGQTERRVPLNAPLEADPAALAEGFVLPLPGRLHFVRRSAGPPVKDLLLPIGGGAAAADAGAAPAWKHVVAAGPDSVVALDGGGRLLRVQYRTAPTPHLFEVTQLTLDTPIDQQPVVHNNRLFLADAAGTLHVLDAATFDVQGEFELGAAASGPLWLAGERLYVETDEPELHCFELAPEVKPLWTAPLGPARAADGGGNGLAGAPLAIEGGVVVACRDGRVRVLDGQTGAAEKQLDLPLPLDSGPLVFGAFTLVPTVDGSVYRVDVSAMRE
ncbi:MAG TPA: PQQ-binding-like beta-propeller repeat protein [Planctomycetaceae bacterium]|nr:PQQ-binding-like beta-propeller repeat protein [Planctomycetaceae bacterium]